MIVAKDVREIFLGIIYSAEGRFFLNDCQIFRSLAVLSSSAKLMSRAVSAILSLDLNSAKNIIYACFMEKLGNKS